MRVKPHTMHTWKEAVAAAYFLAILQPQALQMLANVAYVRSARGIPAVVTAVEVLLILVGAAERIEQPSNVGDRKVVSCTRGLVALVSSFIRYILEVIARVRPPRGGVGEGIHDVWVEELPRLDGVLPRDIQPHDGLRLVDGADPERGVVPEEELDDLAGGEDGDVDSNE